MQSLFSLYKSISEDESRWFYYSSRFCSKDPFRALLGRENGYISETYDFVDNYLRKGNKGQAFCGLLSEMFGKTVDKEKSGSKVVLQRLDHTVSVFLLGILIAEGMEKSLNDHTGLDVNKRNEENVCFLYYWFMMCLYHDIGYVFEQGKCENLEHLLNFITECGICGFVHMRGVEFLLPFEHGIYTMKQVDLYFRKRAKQSEVIDHGIAGGIILYDNLRKNYEIAWKYESSSKESKETYEDFNHNELHYAKKHWGIYSSVANAIVAHNIFKDTLNSYCEEEQRIDLKSMGKISLNSNIFCLILGLADTIEPLKRFAKSACEYEEILKNIYLSCVDDSVCISFSESIKCKPEFISWLGSIHSLSTWLDVEVEPCKCSSNNISLCSVKININHAEN